MRNSIRESTALKKAQQKHARKTYKYIIDELGGRNITLSDIANDEKPLGLRCLIEESGATLDELVVLQQYARAIEDKDTKAASFLRDTAEGSPKQQIALENQSGLSAMSLDELLELKSLLESEKRK